MQELILTLTYDEPSEISGDQPIAVWDHECWERIYLNEGMWMMPPAYGSLANHSRPRKEYSAEEFEKEFGFEIEIILKPGKKCVIRAETTWEVVEN